MPRRLVRLAFAFAVLLTVSFPRFSWWAFAYVALFPLLDGIHQSKSRREAFTFSYLAGFLFFVFSLLWVRHVTFTGLLTFAFLDALVFGVFGMLVKNLFHILDQEDGKKLKAVQVIILFFGIPSLWVVQEFIVVHLPVIGFGFNLLGHSQAALLSVAQTARIFGDYGLSFFCALFSSGLFLLVVNAEEENKGSLGWGQRIVIMVTFAAFAVTIFVYGNYRLAEPPSGDAVRISAIQGNIPQDEKWDQAIKPLVIEKYKKLSLLAKYDGPELMVWPEAAWPGYLNTEFETAGFGAFVDELGIPMIIGSPHYESESAVYNSAYLVEPGGIGISDRYDKVNLVPFGEYVPFSAFFGLFGVEQYARAMGISDFSFGTNSEKLFEFKSVIPAKAGIQLGPRLRGGDIKIHKFAVLICFEDGFSDFARRLAKRGAEFILVITNDAWFMNSAAPYQHLNCSIMRAIENGIYVVRAANTGISAFINPKGEVEDRVMNGEGHDIFVAGGITRPIFVQTASTPYLKFGFMFPFLCLFFLIPAFYPRFFI